MSDATRALEKLLEAVAFAARAHRHQLRKDNQTPYVSHVFRVCLTLRHVFGIDDPAVLTAAVLHDTIEDTTTDCDDLLDRFGADVADWVQQLSKDKRLQDKPREAAYMAVLAKAPWQVQVCKLADIHDNLLDSVNTKPESQQRTFHRSHEYLAALQTNLTEQARKPLAIVSRLLADLEAKHGG